MYEEIVIRRDGSVSVLGTGYYYEETLMEIATARKILELTPLCDAIGKMIARHRETS